MGTLVKPAGRVREPDRADATGHETPGDGSGGKPASSATIAAAATLAWLLAMWPLLGMAGAVVGTFIGRTLWGGANYTAGWITAIVGTILLLWLYRIVFGRQRA